VFSASDADAAWLLCDRHPVEAVAVTLVEPGGSWTDVTFGELRERSQCFAGVLAGLGVGRGDRVATLMGKSVDLVTVLLGIWRVGSVYVPLFTAFAADAVRSRLAAGEVKVVVWVLLIAANPASRKGRAEPGSGPGSELIRSRSQ
jgi:acetyl-CoA synthetase